MMKTIFCIIYVSVILATVKSSIDQNTALDASQNENSGLLKGFINSVINRVRVARSFNYFNRPTDVGIVTIYIREVCHPNARARMYPVRLPYVRYEKSQLEFSKSWIRYSKLMPTYSHPQSRQTIIYARKGAYILPAIVNQRNRIVPISYLLANGYASFQERTGRLPKYYDITKYLKSGQFILYGVPKFNNRYQEFEGPVKTELQSVFEPVCRAQYQEDDDSDSYENLNDNYDPYDDEPESDSLSNKNRPPRRRRVSTKKTETTKRPTTSNTTPDVTTEPE